MLTYVIDSESCVIGKRSHRGSSPHREAWERANGPLPPRTELRRLCDTIRCCEPSHYETARFGDSARRVIWADPLDRLWGQVDRRGDGECWPWTGASRTPGGYGVINGVVPGERLAHRVVYTLLRGQIPVGLDIGHDCHDRDRLCPGGSSCPHRLCVNPAHLLPQTRAENLRAARWARTGKCRNGLHEMTPDNVYRTRTQELCRACRDAREARKLATH